MRPPCADLVAQHLIEACAAVLLGLVILAALIPAVVDAREAARRAVCVNDLRQHSGSHRDTVCLEGGRIAWVSSCWCCGSRPGVGICFVEQKDGELVSSQKALLEGFAVLGEALGRLGQYKLDWCKSGIPGTKLARRYEPSDGT